MVSYRTILFRTTPISTEPYSWVGFHIFKALCRTCLWTDDVRYKMQAIPSSARQPKSWVDGAALHRHEAGLHMQIYINK
jgi:hypothetical protein